MLWLPFWLADSRMVEVEAALFILREELGPPSYRTAGPWPCPSGWTSSRRMSAVSKADRRSGAGSEAVRRCSGEQGWE